MRTIPAIIDFRGQTGTAMNTVCQSSENIIQITRILLCDKAALTFSVASVHFCICLLPGGLRPRAFIFILKCEPKLFSFPPYARSLHAASPREMFGFLRTRRHVCYGWFSQENLGY